MFDWEKELDAWDAKYQPIQNHIDPHAGDKFETYGDELDYVLSIANAEPDRVWTLVDGDDGLYITNGYHLVNRLNYFITKHPFEGQFLDVPYYIFEEEEDA